MREGTACEGFRRCAALRLRRSQYRARALLEQLEVGRLRDAEVLEALHVGTVVVDTAGPAGPRVTMRDGRETR
jgi:hypothetical protein